MVQKLHVDGNTVSVGKFKLNSMVKDPSIVVIAKRGSGKSWVCRDIVSHLGRIGIPCGMIIARTERMNPFYKHFFPDLYIHYEYKTEILERFMYRQRKIIEKREKKKEGGKKVNPRAFLVMDDCLASKTTWAQDKPIKEVFFEGRHYRITFVLTMQFPLGIGPDLRANFDYVFVLADDCISNQKRIYEHYAGMFPNFGLFQQIYSQLTKNYGCMVLVNRGVRESFLDKVFYFRAGEGDGKDAVGSDAFVKYGKRNYDKGWATKDGVIGVEELAMKQKKGAIIKVTLKEG